MPLRFNLYDTNILMSWSAKEGYVPPEVCDELIYRYWKFLRASSENKRYSNKEFYDLFKTNLKTIRKITKDKSAKGLYQTLAAGKLEVARDRNFLNVCSMCPNRNECFHTFLFHKYYKHGLNQKMLLKRKNEDFLIPINHTPSPGEKISIKDVNDAVFAYYYLYETFNFKVIQNLNEAQKFKEILKLKKGHLYPIGLKKLYEASLREYFEFADPFLSAIAISCTLLPRNTITIQSDDNGLHRGVLAAQSLLKKLRPKQSMDMVSGLPDIRLVNLIEHFIDKENEILGGLLKNLEFDIRKLMKERKDIIGSVKEGRKHMPEEILATLKSINYDIWSYLAYNLDLLQHVAGSVYNLDKGEDRERFGILISKINEMRSSYYHFKLETSKIEADKDRLLNFFNKDINKLLNEFKEMTRIEKKIKQDSKEAKKRMEALKSMFKKEAKIETAPSAGIPAAFIAMMTPEQKAAAGVVESKAGFEKELKQIINDLILELKDLHKFWIDLEEIRAMLHTFYGIEEHEIHENYKKLHE